MPPSVDTSVDAARTSACATGGDLNEEFEGVSMKPGTDRAIERPFLMAGGGTGGHVIPVLAVGKELRRRGHEVFFVGTDRPARLREPSRRRRSRVRRARAP